MDIKELHQEFERRYSTLNHPARVKPAFWYLLMIAGLAFLFAWLGWSEPRVPANRRPWIVGVSCGFGFLFLLLAFIAPISWRRLISEIGASAHPIEAIITEESKIYDHSITFWQIGVMCITMPLVIFGVRMFFDGQQILGGTLTAVGGLIAWINFNYTIFQPSSEFSKQLSSVLQNNGYDEVGKQRAKAFLQHSFLKTDSTFEITDYWERHDAIQLFGWGRYSTAGDSLSTGIFCLTEYHLMSAQPLKLVDVLETMASVHYDRESGTLFGTFSCDETSKTSQLAGLPWQYLGSCILCRIDSDLIQSIAKRNEKQNPQFMNEIVESWELISEQLGYEMKR